MSGWLAALGWGLLAGSALLVGAGVGYVVPLSQRIVSSVMALGAGVLVSALSFDLMEEAAKRGGLRATSIGFLAGAVVYSLANFALAQLGARHRKRSGDQQASESEQASSGAAIAVGALLDGVPESIVIGVSLLEGKGVSAVAVAAVFLSNLPEGLSSAAGMKRAGRGPLYVFGVWSAIALASGLAAMLGNVGFANASPEVIAAITAVAAGAILAMLSDTMIPEAFEGSHALTGLLTAIGFLLAFVLTQLA
ncbi:MAG: ZIP family zinc transporter [Polyangiales bacterium]